MSLLGTFRVEGDLLGPVPTGQAQRLLKLLAVHNGRFVPVDTAVEVLWSSRPPDHAERNIAVLASRLRRALGRDRIGGGPSGYRLVLDDRTTVDLFEAEELVRSAERELAGRRHALAATAAERAAELLGAGRPLTEERDAPWTADVRLLAERQLRRARLCWWSAALELRAHRVVVDVATAALRDDPLDEEACRAVMAAHQRTGESGQALLVYKALRTTLAEQLGTDPSPATQAMFLSVLRAENVPSRSGPDPAPEGGPLVGRDTELAGLLTRWTDAVAGRPGLAVVVGEAGIGKSALVEALAARVRQTGALVLTGSCFEAERSLYLQPLLEAVRAGIARSDPRRVRELAGDGLGTLIELIPEIARVTGPVPYERVGSEIEHRKSLDALATYLERLAGDQPVLLVIEDLQHAGASTVEALHFLVTRWERSRILAVATERTGDEPAGSAGLRDVASLHELGALTEPAVAELVRDSGLGYDVAKLFAWTGGSPLFVTELLRHPAPGGTLTVPGSLHEAVAERLEHAGEEVSTLLGLGAVLGSSFSLDEVAALGGIAVEECAQQAGRALRAGLLVTRGDHFRFPNDIVSTIAYDAVPEPVRVSRHRRAARLTDNRPEAAARHLAAAHDWVEAARALGLAAHAAHLAFANDESERLLTDALEAALRSGDRSVCATVRLRRGRIRTELDRHDGAREDHEQALVLARELGDEELEARALEQLGWTALYARDVLGAADLAEQATQLAESAAAAKGALPSATLLLGRVRHWDGDYAGAGAAYDRVLESGTGEATTAVALAYRGALLQHQDRFSEARVVLERAAVLCRQTGQFRPLLQTLFFIGLARGDVGDFGGALRSLDRARALIDGYGVSYYRAGIETTTSWLWQELGEVGRAREHAELAVELAHRGGGALELEQELHALLALADCDLRVGRFDDAGARVEAAAPMLERSLPFKPRATMRLLELRARFDPTWAEALFEEARTHSSPKYRALALAHLGRTEAAARVAGRIGSDLLVGRLGSQVDRRAARDRIARALPAALRTSYLRESDVRDD